MIVNCPNCSLEQPLDPFCAGCGKQLPKLIAEQKRKAKVTNNRTRKFILVSVIFFSLGFYIYYAYQHPEARPFAQASDTPKVKVIMSKGTIKAPTYKQKEFSKPLKVKSFAVGSDQVAKAAPAPTDLPQEPKLIKKTPPDFLVQEVYIIGVENCTNGEIENGPLSDDELAFFLDCSKVLLKLGNEETAELDPNLPFSSTTSFNAKGKNLSLVVEFAFEDPPVKTTKNLVLSQTSIRKAGHINQILTNKSMSSYIAERSPMAQKELQGSYAASVLLGLSTDDKPSPKGYFLTVYE
jgi:hypothetical protein